MLVLNLILLAITLALFVFVCYSVARSRSNPDYHELRDDVDGLLRRESTKLARERASLRRNVEEHRDAAPDGAPPSDISPIGGVVRKEIATPGATPTGADTRPRRRA